MLEQQMESAYVIFCDPDDDVGFLSNMFKCNVVTHDGFTYNCCEQLIQSEKARLFKVDNMDILCHIMQCDDPSKQRELGRKIKGFDSKIWNQHKFQIMMNSLKVKFANPELSHKLLATGNKTLIYSNPVDRIWGCGMSYEQLVNCYPRWTDDFFEKVDNGTESVDDWVQVGPNLLGKALENVRASLRGESDVWNLVEFDAMWHAS